MTSPWATAPQCSFYVRTQVTNEPTYRYDHIEISSPESDGKLRTPWPPSVGDTIQLYDSLRRIGGVYRVIERSWLHSSYGSANWPYVRTQAGPAVGPLLDIVVEPSTGLFVNEAELEADETDDEDEE